MAKVVLSGNEAVARGAYEAGVHVATAYPGTPSTEILENIGKHYPEIYAEWAPNEKVAVEVAMGASFGGARSLAAMKHVGVNVAADPMFSFAYTGVNGGFILVSADDPSMHSSQNEQDNRWYGKFAKIPVLEPSDSQEAKEFVILGYQISERFNTPVILRLTTRISHSKSVVELGERKEVPVKPYVKDQAKYIVMPHHARVLHKKLEDRLKKLKAFSETTDVNRIEWGDREIGIVTDSISYQYAKEVFPDATILKLGMVFPFPDKKVRELAEAVKKVYVIEENEPFIEEHIRMLGISCVGKEKVPILYELNQKRVMEAFFGKSRRKEIDVSGLPPRPPALCPGCPHRSLYYAAHRLKLTVTGDIGCYTLGTMPPLDAMDTCICMGASIGNAFGLELAQGKDFSKKMIATIGDSTFVHSGMTGLAEVAYNKGITTVVILDNSVTAMTGGQQHPATGKTLRGEPTRKLDFVALAKAMGIEKVYEMDAYNLKEVKERLNEATDADEPVVIVNKGKCILERRGEKFVPFAVDVEKCIGCKICLGLGCPAISFDKEKNKAQIDPILCVGSACTLCSQVCPTDAIGEIDGKEA
ncbi:indolepyruvate ferredoxin oxidoreductase subunit alpha [bacterium]|nr:indolepyruvate ferredoxin oxidoreductase subunit alpha [bacterium]